MQTVRTLVFALASSSPLLPAQQTWIVDPGGSGNFTDLAAAIAGAAPGDTLLVRTGSYGPAVINKPLQVLGAGSALVRVSSLTIGPFPAGNAVVAGLGASRLSVNAPSSIESVSFDEGSIANHAVVLRGCVFGSPYPWMASLSGPPLTVSSGNVVLNDCSGSGTPSYVWVTLGCHVYNSHPALIVTGGTVTIANSTLNGISEGPVACPWVSLNGYPASAVVVVGGTLVVTASTLTGGQLLSGGRLAAVAGSFLGDPSTVTLPASTTMTPVFLPATAGSSAQPGGAIAYRIETLPALPAILAASLGMRSPSPTPLGTAWVDPGDFVFLLWGISDVNGRLGGSIPLPTWVPRGLLLTIQGAAVSPATGDFTLGAPVIAQVL